MNDDAHGEENEYEIGFRYRIVFEDGRFLRVIMHQHDVVDTC